MAASDPKVSGSFECPCCLPIDDSEAVPESMWPHMLMKKPGQRAIVSNI